MKPLNSTAVLVARIVLGCVMLPHGVQKTLGWFGGYGFVGTMNFFTTTMHIPWVFALAAILAESVGAIALIAGLGTRLAAAAIATNMVVAVLTSHLANGFFMNWFGNQKGEGFEYHLLAIGLALVLMIQGGGRWSADGWITGRSTSNR
ncbi:MAG: DoxX family protein [Vicinamibacteria bacterium]